MSSSDFVTRGRALIERGQFQDAVRVCRLGLLANPTAVDGRLVLASALLALRRYDEVLAEMRVALETDGTDARALRLKGEALLRKGDARQALDVLEKARRHAPADPAILALVREAELGGGSGGFGDSDSPENMTKHYPAHRGAGASEDPSSGQVTRPTSALRNAQTPAPEELAIGDKSGTMELDPDLEGIELPSDLDDPPADPPLPLRAAARLEDSVIELDEDDLVEGTTNTRRPSPLTARLTPSDATADYRRPADDFDEGATEVAEPPVDFGAVSTSIGTAPETPRSKPPAYPVAAAPVGSGPDLDELFPDDASRVDIVAPRPPAAAAAAAGSARVAKVSALASTMAPAQPGARNNRSRTEDMRMIRAGLGLEDSDERRARANSSRRSEQTEHIRRETKTTSEPRGKQAAKAAPLDRPRGKRKDDKVAVPKVADVQRTQAIRKQGRGGGARFVYVILALLVVGGGAYAGFEIRTIRLDRQIRAADVWGLLDDGAQSGARVDTYIEYVGARDAYRNILDVRDDERTRGALARAQAALAAEFGDGRDQAVQLVASLGGTMARDAVVARAYLAIAQAEAEGAELLAKQIIQQYPAEPMGPYLLGRAYLLGGKPDEAAEEFRKALRLGQHTAVRVGLGMAEAARGRYPEAQAAFDRALDVVPGHPAAIIGRARVAARRTDLLADEQQPEQSLLALIAEGERPLAEQRLGVSREQRAWAALALAQVKLARGDTKAAREAVAQAQEIRPPDDYEFHEALAAALLRVGDDEAAKAEVDRAVERWPDRPEARVLLAEVALLRGEPAQALEALQGAGDLGRNAQALALRGQARLALGKIAEATEDLDAALALKPDLRPAMVARAQVDLARDDARAALARLEKLYDESAGPALSVAYAAALRRTGEPRKARDILGDHLDGPLSGQAQLELARLERDAGDFRAARAAYAKAIELMANAVDARLEAALLALDTGDAPGAREALDALATEQPDNGRVLIEAARVRTLTGDVEGADKLLVEAEKLDSAPRWLLARERGRTALRRQLPKAAVAELERAVSLRSDDGETRLLLIDAHLQADDGPAARRTLEDVLKRFAARPEKHLALGRVDLFFDRLPDARSAFEKARKQYEQEKAGARHLAEADYWIGRVNYYDNKLPAAATALRRAVNLSATHGDAWFFLGLAELDRRRYGPSADAFEKAVTVDPSGVSIAWFYLGEAAYKGRKWKLARKALEEYVQRVPDGDFTEEARTMLKRLK